jgi:hypothetical protein
MDRSYGIQKIFDLHLKKNYKIKYKSNYIQKILVVYLLYYYIIL